MTEELIKYYTERSSLKCSVQDLIDGKIPLEFSKNRALLYGFAFVHNENGFWLYPSKIDIWKKSDKGIITFEAEYEPKETDDTVILKKSESFIHTEIHARHFSASLFNTYFEEGDTINPLFSVVSHPAWIKPKVYDDYENITAHFLDRSDMTEYRKFIEKYIVD